MFESICITQQNKTDYHSQLDIGFLAEALLFYQSVRVVGDSGVLEQLITQCGLDPLFNLIDSGRLKLTYLENMTGVQTINTGTMEELHAPAVVKAEKNSFEVAAPLLLHKVTGRSGKSRRLANWLSKKIEITSFDSRLLKDSIQDFENQVYIQESVRVLLSLLAPEYYQKDELRFEIVHEGNHFRVQSNIDFEKANESYIRHVPGNYGSLTPAYMLAFLIDVRKNLGFCSYYFAEIATSQSISRLIESKFSTMLTSGESEAQIGTFQDFIMDDARAIRESINSGARTFSDFIQVLDKAAKFRHWLNEQPRDINLAKAYYREVTKSTWVDRLPIKIARWAFFTGTSFLLDLGLGPIAAPLNIVLSAADTFLLDSLIKGWKPDQFIESSLIPFVKR